MVMPKEDHNDLLESLLEKIPKRVDPPKSGVRLLISGSVLDNPELLRIAEIAGGNIVIDDLCTGSRYFWDSVDSDSDPWHAVAERYLRKISSFSMMENEERFKHTIEMAKQFDVEAVLILTLKHCDTHLFDAPQLINEVKNLGLPVLHLEWEHSQSGLAQLKTRIEAFIEMVSGVG